MQEDGAAMSERVQVTLRSVGAVDFSLEVVREHLDQFIEGTEQARDGLIRINHARMVAGALWPWQAVELHPLPVLKVRL